MTAPHNEGRLFPLPGCAVRLVPLVAVAAFACSDYELTQGTDKTGQQDSGGRDFNPRDDTDDTQVDDTDSGAVDNPDTAEDDVPDGKIDVALVIDIAYLYDCYHANLQVQTAALIDSLFDSGADVAIGAVTYDDYFVDNEWYTAWEGYPYTMVQQLTTDRATAKTSMSTLELEWGGDDQGDGHEALLQVAAGLGYDQDCDGKYEEYYDIKPFNSTAGDAFGGNSGALAKSGVPGSGTTAGIGWRTDSKRVVILVIENDIRDRSYGDEMPGGCPSAATKSDAVTALKNADIEFLGINAYEYQHEDPRPQEQLEALATSVGSKIDADGDGSRDDLAVLSGSWDWPATPKIVSAIWDLTK